MLMAEPYELVREVWGMGCLGDLGVMGCEESCAWVYSLSESSSSESSASESISMGESAVALGV